MYINWASKAAARISDKQVVPLGISIIFPDTYRSVRTIVESFLAVEARLYEWKTAADAREEQDKQSMYQIEETLPKRGGLRSKIRNFCTIR